MCVLCIEVEPERFSDDTRSFVWYKHGGVRLVVTSLRVCSLVWCAHHAGVGRRCAFFYSVDKCRGPGCASHGEGGRGGGVSPWRGMDVLYRSHTHHTAVFTLIDQAWCVKDAGFECLWLLQG